MPFASENIVSSDNNLDYPQRISGLHRQLGIPGSYSSNPCWILHPEPAELADAGPDFYGRPQRLTPAALQAWQGMVQEAANQGITLLLISAFRGVDYQCELIRKKLAKGQTIEQILCVNAAPGFSEHHTGRAVDIGTEDCPALEEEFEQTHAFRWLQANAGRFGFTLSYPRNNPAGITYEPWHWCFRDGNDLDQTR